MIAIKPLAGILTTQERTCIICKKNIRKGEGYEITKSFQPSPYSDYTWSASNLVVGYICNACGKKHNLRHKVLHARVRKKYRERYGNPPDYLE